MWYLVLSGTFAAWVLLDGISRNSGRAAVAWAIGTLFLGPIFLPIYMARRPLKKGEVREGGTAWNALKYFAILWTIVMAVASFSALMAVGRHVTSLRSDAERAGAGLGMIFGMALLAALWLVPTLGAALLGFLLKKNTALEAGPTGPLVGIIRIGSTYTTIVLGCVSIIFMLFLINGIFRGAGDATLAMRTLWLANVINIVLDPCLINGWGPFPKLGVVGAAVATATGRGIGVAFQLWMLLGGRGRVVVRRADLKLNLDVLIRLARVSASGMMQFLVSTASWLGLVRIIALFGAAALAGYTIAIRIIIFAILPSWGMANAAATLVGQNLGAGKPDRAERSVWITGFYNMLFLAGVAIVFIAFAERLIGIFATDPEVLRYGTSCLRWVSYGYVFYAYGMVMVQAFNGAGDTVTPTLINLFCYWLWQIPMAYTLSRILGFGPTGVFAAIAISESTLAVVSMAVFRRGRWKQQKI